MMDTAKQTPLTTPKDRPSDHRKSSFAESRLDPLTGNWTIYSPQRGDRPEEFVESVACADPSQLQCPFCPGNESETPKPVWVGCVSDEDSSLDITQSMAAESDANWSVRVVPNKFPAVDSIDTKVSAGPDSGLFQRHGISGGHEVIIESRQHVQSLSELDLPELNLVFRAYRDRMQYWRSVPGISYLSVFKNVGVKAGASLSHSHSQLIATDRVPAQIQNSLDQMTRHHASSGCCLMSDLVRGEIKAKKRVVWGDKDLVAFCPFASHLPMMVRLTTLEHESCFENLGDKLLESVSRLVRRVVSWLEKVRPGTAYNFCLHSLPPAMGAVQEAFQWWIDIFPRMTQVAGFEWSSQCMINPILPEDAASKLRSCARAEDPRRL